MHSNWCDKAESAKVKKLILCKKIIGFSIL